MRTRPHYPLNLKLLFLALFLALSLLVVLKSTFSSSSSNNSENSSFIQPPKKEPKSSSNYNNNHNDVCFKTCNKIPPLLAHAIMHYSTSTITPQQTLNEVAVTAKVLHDKSPCNFLVFGLGHDSLMWSALNYGGRTVFLEEDSAWIDQIKQRFPMLESYHVVYSSKVNQANDLMEVGKGQECNFDSENVDLRHSVCQLALKGLPDEMYETQWDLIMVDAPTGYYDEAPGRMTAIYTAGMMARNRVDGETHVFVHDVNRQVEDNFSRAFLCEGYMRKQEGRLRHFVIPSCRDGTERPFCP